MTLSKFAKKKDRILGNPTLTFQVTHRHNLYKYTGISVFRTLKRFLGGGD